MNNYREILITLAWRVIIAGLVTVLGWVLIGKAEGGFGAVPLLLLGMALWVTAAIIVAPSIARLLAERSGRLFYPTVRFDRPQPMYSIPESKRKRGLVHEAFDGFQAISQTYPQELKPYIEMIDIAIMDLKNGELAQSTFRHGMRTLKNKHDRDALSRMYTAISSRLDAANPKPAKPITLKKSA